MASKVRGLNWVPPAEAVSLVAVVSLEVLLNSLEAELAWVNRQNLALVQLEEVHHPAIDIGDYRVFEGRLPKEGI